MSLILRDQSELRRSVLSFFLLEAMVQFQYLFTQYLCSQLSARILIAFSMLSFLSIVFQVISAALGESNVVLTGHDPKLSEIRKYFGGALGIYMGASACIVVTLYAFQTSAVRLLEVEELPYLNANYALWVGISFLLGLNTFFGYLFAIVDRSQIFRINIFSLITNIVLGIVVYLVFEDPDVRFTMLNLAMLLSLLGATLVGLFSSKKYVKLKLANIYAFWHRGLKVFLADLAMFSVRLSLPFFYSKVLSQAIGGESVAAYNVGYRIVEIFTLLLWGVQFIGVTWLMQIKLFKGEPEWDYCLKTISTNAVLMVGLPIVVVASLYGLFVPNIFNLTSPDSSLIAAATVLSILPNVFGVSIICRIKAFELQYIRAMSLVFSTYMLGLPITYLAGKALPIAACMLLGVVLPPAVDILLLSWYLKRHRIGTSELSGN